MMPKHLYDFFAIPPEYDCDQGKCRERSVWQDKVSDHIFCNKHKEEYEQEKEAEEIGYDAQPLDAIQRYNLARKRREEAKYELGDRYYDEMRCVRVVPRCLPNPGAGA